MTMTSRIVRPLLTAACLLALGATPALAQPSGPVSVPPPGLAAGDQIPILKDVAIDQKLDGPIPMDLMFTDETGRDVRLGSYFGDKPVVMALVYYECPMLCTMILNGLVGSLESLAFNPGEEYEVVIVSFDPGETPALALTRKNTYMKRFGRPETADGWHYLTGRQESIAALTDAVGFRYAYVEDIDQWAHPAAITIATPDGRVSKYLYGIDFAPRDLRLALVEATDGQIGTAVDQALLFCYHYDPETGTYGFVVMNLIRVGGIVTLLAMGGAIFLSLRRERRQRHNAVHGTATGTR
jgi:protein SCO1/2